VCTQKRPQKPFLRKRKTPVKSDHLPHAVQGDSVLPAEGDPRMAGISDETLSAVDEEVRRITDECYAEARRLLRENRAGSIALSNSS
jgi:ATP-dependent Zn protease